MTFLSTVGVTSAMAALVALASPVQAGEHDITGEEVEAYFGEVQEEAAEIMRAGELHRMIAWIEDNFADGAVLQASMNVIRGDEHKAFIAMTLDKDDLLRMGGMFAGAFQQMDIEDFALEVEVIDVIPHGPGAASVTSQWRESFTVAMPATDGEPAAGPLMVEEVADCTQVVQRSGERLMMGLMTCTGEVRF